jgi:hypothetical protein
VTNSFAVANSDDYRLFFDQAISLEIQSHISVTQVVLGLVHWSFNADATKLGSSWQALSA